MSKELFKASNISISFTQYITGLKQRELKVINDLSMEISEGEIVTVLGSSGSGKSLLAQSILGILPSNSRLTGEMTYKGEALTEKRKEELRGDEIALIPQSVKYLDPLMKISQQAIGEYGSEEEKKEQLKKQREIFKKYNLDEKVDDMYPFQLSGGMARRVLISTALLSNPKLVIADEPTPGLDEKSIDETLKYLKEMANNDVGILLITHDIEAALRVSDKIAIFYAGYVIEIANIEDFTGDGEKLLHPYTQSLFKALPANGFEFTDGHQPIHGEHNEGCPYYKRCPHPSENCNKKSPVLTMILNKQVRCNRANEFKDTIIETELNKGDI